jgi:hypothetical protein
MSCPRIGDEGIAAHCRRGVRVLNWWLLALALGTVYLTARGIVPGLRQGQDFAPVYCASRLWMRGLDPYDDSMLKAEGARNGITTPIGLPNFPAVYPPLGLIGTAPVALLPYPVARATVLVLNLLALAGCWWLLARRFCWSTQDGRSLALGLVILSLAGVHTCLKDGQLTPVVLLGILAALDPAAGKMRSSLGWVVALFKYSIPVPYMALSARRRSWEHLVGLFFAGGLFLAGVALVAAPLGIRALLHSYAASVNALFSAAAWDDPTQIGGGTASMLWLEALLYRILAFAPAAVPALNLIAITMMVFVVALLILRCRDEGRLLLVIAAFVLLSSYHRVYDAVLLLPGIAWLIDRGARRLGRETVLLAALLVPFLLPGPAVLESWLSEALKRHWPVYALAIPHQTWCLLGIFVVASRGVVAEALAPHGRRTRVLNVQVVS